MYKLDNFNPFRDECHNASVKAGWWSTSNRYADAMTPTGLASIDVDPDRLTIPTKLCLIHSEISEAYDGYLSGAPDEHLPNWPGALIEFGDTNIRIGDLAGYLDIDITGAIAMVQQADHISLEPGPMPVVKWNGTKYYTANGGFALLHRWVSDAMEGFRKSSADRLIPAMPALSANLARVVILVDMIAERNGWSLADACRAKMAYNAVREDHKLEARAAGGKAF